MAAKEAAESHDEDVKKIGEFIKGIDITMMTTIDENGGLQSRPMATQKAEFNGDIYFFTYDSSNKVKHIKANSRVNLAYSAPDKQDYVSIKGAAEVSHSKQKMEELWSADLNAWFPQGLETPGITLIKVAAESAEYWDSPSSMVAHAIGLVKGAITGHTSPTGDNETIEFKS